MTTTTEDYARVERNSREWPTLSTQRLMNVRGFAENRDDWEVVDAVDNELMLRRDEGCL